MKFFHELENLIHSKIEEGADSIGALLSDSDVQAKKNDLDNHPSGLTSEELGIPPLPPGFTRKDRKHNFKYDVGAAVSNLIRQGKVDLVQGKLKAK